VYLEVTVYGASHQGICGDAEGSNPLTGKFRRSTIPPNM
jgi:hypothetical protein